MKRFGAVCALLWCLQGTLAYAGDAYLCTTEMVTGFSFDKGEHGWQVAHFHSDSQYIVSRLPSDGTQWQVVPVGEAMPSGFCKDDFSPDGVLTCRGFDEFKMNKANLRFIHAYLVGYWTDGRAGQPNRDPSLFKEGENSPFLEIGKCAPM